MAKLTLASYTTREVAIARRNLQLGLDDHKLLGKFFTWDLVSMIVATDMIADGTINSAHFFLQPLSKVAMESGTGTQVPDHNSFLDYLIDFYRQDVPGSEELEEDLIDDFEIVFMVLSACRSHGADTRVRELANHPHIVAKTWQAFAQRLQNLPLDIAEYKKPIRFWVDSIFMRGLEEVEKLPPSMMRATSALELARSAYMLINPRERRTVFYHLFDLLLSTSNIGLIRKAVLSVRRLEHVTDLGSDSFGIIAWRLVDEARKTASPQMYRAVLKAIGELIGYHEKVVKQWYKKCSLSRESPASWARRHGSSFQSRT